jgi:glutamate dehydrogenase (NADP+)
VTMDIDTLIKGLREKDPHQTYFHQAAGGLLEGLGPFLRNHPRYADSSLFARLFEPERVIIFRVPWVDDQGQVRVNRGFRVQMNGSLGPYKGGLRFHPSVNLDVLRFLALEQTIKNALTDLPLGSGKGGADFDPHGRSDGEIMRFCQAFMAELFDHIGSDVDVPAGDIGVGAREIGYLFGMYRKLHRSHDSGAITGKSPVFGGSLLRTEATGYGLVYFLQYMLQERGEALEGRRVAVSGAGNVARYAAEKVLIEGGIVISLSDSRGALHAANGLTREHLETLDRIQAEGGRLHQLPDHHAGLTYQEGIKPWRFSCDIALPCATQNELNEQDARALVDNGCRWVVEGANMPTTTEAVSYLVGHGVGYAPGKAANAGGVAVSGLEMSQNSLRHPWSREEVDRRLHDIMSRIHHKCLEYGGQGERPDYVQGASVAGFVRVAEAMLRQGVV